MNVACEPRRRVRTTDGRASQARLATLATLAGLLSVAPAACLAPAQRRHEDLSRIVREYNDGLRWRRFEQVVPHLRPAAVEQLMSRAAAAAPDLEIADQEVTIVRVADGATRADVTATFTWYTQRSGVVRKTLVAQEWRFENGRWTCVAQHRLAGEPLSLLHDATVSPTAPPLDAGVAPAGPGPGASAAP